MTTFTIEPAPKNRLGADCAIGCDAEFAKALEEMAYLDNQKRMIVAQADLEKSEIDAAAEKAMFIKVGRTPVPYGERMVALFDAVEAYAGEHWQRLLEGSDKKSREFTHATISWREQPLAIGYCRGCNESTVLAKLEEETTFRSRIEQLVSKCVLKVAAVFSMFVDVKVSLSKQRLLSGYRSGAITAEILQEYGVRIEGGEEKFSVKTHQSPINAESTAAV